MVIQLPVQLVPIEKVSYSHSSAQLHVVHSMCELHKRYVNVILSSQYPVYYTGSFILGVTASPFDSSLD